MSNNLEIQESCNSSCLASAQDGIAERVKSILMRIAERRAGIEVSELLDGAKLEGNLGLDSFVLQEVVMEIEEEFELDLSDESLDGVKTVGETVEFVKRKLQGVFQ